MTHSEKDFDKFKTQQNLSIEARVISLLYFSRVGLNFVQNVTCAEATLDLSEFVKRVRVSVSVPLEPWLEEVARGRWGTFCWKQNWLFHLHEFWTYWYWIVFKIWLLVFSDYLMTPNIRILKLRIDYIGQFEGWLTPTNFGLFGGSGSLSEKSQSRGPATSGRGLSFSEATWPKNRNRNYLLHFNYCCDTGHMRQCSSKNGKRKHLNDFLLIHYKLVNTCNCTKGQSPIQWLLRLNLNPSHVSSNCYFVKKITSIHWEVGPWISPFSASGRFPRTGARFFARCRCIGPFTRVGLITGTKVYKNKCN